MQIDTGSFKALTDQVAALATRVGQLEHDAFMIRTLEEMWFEKSRWTPPPRDSRTGRSRHLRPVDGSQP